MPGGLISSPVGGEGGARSRPAPPPQRCVSPAGSRKIQPLARRALLLCDDDDDDDDGDDGDDDIYIMMSVCLCVCNEK